MRFRSWMLTVYIICPISTFILYLFRMKYHPSPIFLTFDMPETCQHTISQAPPHFPVTTIVQIDRTIIIHISLRGPTSLSKNTPKASKYLFPLPCYTRHTVIKAYPGTSMGCLSHREFWKHLQDFPVVLSQMCLHPTLTPTPTPAKDPHSSMWGISLPSHRWQYAKHWEAPCIHGSLARSTNLENSLRCHKNKKEKLSSIQVYNSHLLLPIFWCFHSLTPAGPDDPVGLANSMS